jgi:myosin-5
VTVNNEITVVPLRKEVAKEYLDALAKEIYASIFLWLVRSINGATCATEQDNSSPALSKESLGIIGLLDIFGFEYFETNGFEQLCINFANEMLQSKFTKDIFQSVYEEYACEGLSFDRIHYDDNTNFLDLLQTPRTGLMSVLNEECIMPGGSDEAFCRKAIANAKAVGSDVLFVKPLFESYNFGIRHYASNVIYDCRGFLTKNQDTLPWDLVECVVTKSTNPIIVLELSNEESRPEKAPTGRRRGSALVAPTVWTKYRTQLVALMGNMEESQNRYIRCIKPNDKKLPNVMEHAITLEQLRSAGVISAVTMSRSAFPNRLEHKQVLDRFEPVWRLFWCKRSGISLPQKSKKQSKRDLYKEDVEVLLSGALKPLEFKENEKFQSAFAVGKTRTYFVAGALEYLEALRFRGLELCAIVIQRLGRGAVVRQVLNHSLFLARIDARQRIQMWRRCVLAKRVYFELRRKYLEVSSRLRLQCWFRTLLANTTVSNLRNGFEIERRRKARELRNIHKRKAAATCIQKAVREKNKRVKFAVELHMARKYEELDDEAARLEREGAELEAAYFEGEREHTKELEELEEERNRQAADHQSRYFGDSFSSMGSVLVSPMASPNGGRRKSVLEDEVQTQRRANKKLRKEMYRLEEETKALEQNIETLSNSNNDARNAIFDAKNVYLRLIVKNTMLDTEAEKIWDEMQKNAYWKKTRLSQYEVEKQIRSNHLKTLKKVVKAVKKKIPDTRLATEIDRVATSYINTESRRFSKGGVNRQDSMLSLTSITSATEHSDSESELNVNFG